MRAGTARSETARLATLVKPMHDDADAEMLELGADDEGADRCERDHGGADQDQHALRGRGGVLELLVAVAVFVVGRSLGAADGEERDKEASRSMPECIASVRIATSR